MQTHIEIPDWLSKVIVGAISGLAVQLLLLVGKNAVRIISKLIHEAKQRQKMEQSDFFNTYADMEEILGDFLEKYREIARATPNLSRWEFFRLLLFDIFCIIAGLIKMALIKLVGSDEVPKA